MISVVLVDDQKLIRQGVRSLLEISERISVAGEASNGREAMAVIEDTDPDVILLDIQMPILDGIGCLRLLRDKGNTTPVIILTTFENPEQMIECTRLGARGYLLKDVSLDQLVAAIETVHQGGTMIQPAVTATILDRLQKNDSPPKALPTGETLTPRETEVLRCLAAGLSNREIGNAVNLTEGTVKNHVSNILAKLNVRDRTRAVLKAIDHGLL
jgi:DNA-binding NarL/FixJ family response regulator